MGSVQFAQNQMKIQILKQQDEIARLQRDIAKNSESAGPSAMSSSRPGNLAQPAVAPHAAAWHLLSVTGFANHLHARVMVDGRAMLVQPGQVVRGGWRVQRITPSFVVFVREHHVKILRM
jgi:type IV pilus biogenesis protein PilP